MNSAYREFDEYPPVSGSPFGGKANLSDELQKLAGDIQHFSKNVNMLEKLCSSFSSSQAHQLKQDILDLFGDTTQLAKIADSGVKKLLKRKSDLPQPARVQFDRLVRVLSESMEKFVNLQQITARIEKTKTGTFSAGASSYDSRGDYRSQGYDEREREDAHLLSDNRVDVQRMAELDDDMQHAQHREEAMRQLETDIVDINDIFRDLGTMVSEQGDMIDNIEANVEVAAIKVESGNRELAAASRHKSCSRKLTCCILIILLAVLIAIVVAVAVILKIADVY